jgi:hypothetical protein
VSYRAEASGGKASGVEDQELMNAIGRMVLSAATLEYSVAVLVALTEGHQDQAAENRALQLVQTDGAPVRELRRIALGPPERRDLNRLCQEAEAVLEERNAVVHAIPLEDSAAGAEGSLTGWHPRPAACRIRHLHPPGLQAGPGRPPRPAGLPLSRRDVRARRRGPRP